MDPPRGGVFPSMDPDHDLDPDDLPPELAREILAVLLACAPPAAWAAQPDGAALLAAALDEADRDPLLRVALAEELRGQRARGVPR